MGAGIHDGGKLRTLAVNGAVGNPEAADGETAAQSLGPGNAVRFHIRSYGAPSHDVAATAKAALHFIHQQKKIMLPAQLRQAPQKFRSHAVDPSFSLDGFQHEGHRFRPDGFAGRFQIVERQMAESRQHGVKADFDFILPRGGHAAQRPPVEGFVERKHLITGLAVRLGLAVPVTARYFD